MLIYNGYIKLKERKEMTIPEPKFNIGDKVRYRWGGIEYDVVNVYIVRNFVSGTLFRVYAIRPAGQVCCPIEAEEYELEPAK